LEEVKMLYFKSNQYLKFLRLFELQHLLKGQICYNKKGNISNLSTT